MKHLLLSLALLAGLQLTAAEAMGVAVNGTAQPCRLHPTPMERRLVLHPEQGECNFSGAGYLDLTFRLRRTGSFPVTVALRDTTRRINDPERSVKRTLKGDANSEQRFRFYFATTNDCDFMIDPAKIGRILIESDSPQSFQSFELIRAELGGKPGELPPGEAFAVTPSDGRLFPSREIELEFPDFRPAAGPQGAVLNFPPRNGQLFRWMPKGRRWNLSQADRAVFRLRNPGSTPVTATCMVSGSRICAKQHSAWNEAMIPPNTVREIEVLFKGRDIWHCRLVAADRRAERSDEENERAKGPESFGGSVLWNEAVPALAIAANAPLILEEVRAVSGVFTPPAWSGKRPPVPGDWTLTLSDEFDGDSINPAIWKSGWSWKVPNPRLLCNYSPRNLIVKNGMLHIRAEKKVSYFDDNTPDERYYRAYTSGSMTTFDRFAQRYGYFEARLRPATIRGVWPAFWTMPDHGRGSQNRWRTIYGGTEIDIFEQPGRFGPHRNNIACHWFATPALKEHRMMGFSRIYMARDKDGFVTSGVLWEPGKLTWYLNGEAVAEWNSPSVPSVAVYLKLCVQVGGWGGFTLDEDKLPYDFLVDYVKVWQRSDLAELNRKQNAKELFPER